MRLICDKLELKPGERLLDIGCGWGGLARFAAQEYGVEVTGTTISKEQQHLAKTRCAGLPVTIELMDYRDLSGHFDKVVSVGIVVIFEVISSQQSAIIRYYIGVRRVLNESDAF